MITMLTFVFFVCVLFHFPISHGVVTQFGTKIACDKPNGCENQHLISGIECDIKCSADESCKNSKITFSKNCDFNVLKCSSIHSCHQTKIYCSVGAICEINAHHKSLIKSSIYCPEDGTCDIHCKDTKSCAYSDIYCPIKGQCFIQCDGKYDSCKYLTIYAQNASSINIWCNGDNCDYLKLYAPTNINNNASISFFRKGNKEIEIYSVNGLSGVSIINTENTSNASITVYCNTDYSETCAVSLYDLDCDERNNVCSYQQYQDTTYTTSTSIERIEYTKNDIDHSKEQNSTTYDILLQLQMLITKHKVFVLAGICIFVWLWVWCCFCVLHYGKQNRLKKQVKREQRQNMFDEPDGEDQMFHVNPNRMVDAKSHDAFDEYATSDDAFEYSI